MKPKGKVHFYRDSAGFARWRLSAPNGRVLASGEGFSSMAKARASWRAVVRYAAGAVEK